MVIALLLMLVAIATLMTNSVVSPIEWLVSIHLPIWFLGVLALLLFAWLIGE
jgi:hypothetical protein